MIRTKAELKECLAYEKSLYFNEINGSYIRCRLLNSKFYVIFRFIKALRHAEYHKNMVDNSAESSALGGNGRVVAKHKPASVVHKLGFIYWHRRKYLLGNRLHFEIPENTCGKGLMIYHIAPIVINGAARIGEDCRISGNFCLGIKEDGRKGPQLGDHITAGWGCCVIGDVKIADGVKLGAGSVVVRDVPREGAAVAGVPGKVIG